MTKAKKIALSWSGGKDAAFCLEQLLEDPDFEVVALLTTFHESTDRSSMHGHEVELLRAQAKSIGIPLFELWIASDGAEGYDQAMKNGLSALKNQYEIEGVAFGDLFLEDVRNYRENKMAATGIAVYFPIWGMNTDKVAQSIASRYQAHIACLTAPTLSKKWMGRPYDQHFLAELPFTVDPCGENGEFHTFVTHAPYFSAPIAINQEAPFFKPVNEEFKNQFGVTGHWYIDFKISNPGK